MKPRFRLILLVVLLLAVSIQLVQPVRSNPPVTADLDAPAPVKAVLKRACYDCHSNETSWPWYSAIAPSSWFVARHVDEGRHHFNFSDWGTYDTGKQAQIAEEIVDEIQAGEMPLSSYLLLHSAAALSDADKRQISAWSSTVGRGKPSRSDGD